MKTIASNIIWTPCGDIQPGNTPIKIDVTRHSKQSKEVIKEILQDKYGFGIKSFDLIIIKQ